MHEIVGVIVGFGLNTDTIIESASKAAFGARLVNNAIRSVISEAIVDAALDDGWAWCSGGWAKCDFQHRDGTCLEVKQSAALQTWHRPGDKPSKGQFDIAPRKGYYDDGSAWVDYIGRNAHIYVFAWHPEANPDIADHRDPHQWQFFVVSETRLSREAKTISLSQVRRLADPDPVGAGHLNEAVAKHLKGKSTAAE